MRNRPPVRVVEVTHEERVLLRQLIRTHAFKLGYAKKYHDDIEFPGGPHEWPRPLQRANALIRKLQEHRYAGGLAWPEDASSQPSTPTARNARR